MGKTITGTATLGVTLTANPTIIDGTIATYAEPAIYGSAAKVWTINNNGLISAASEQGAAIRNVYAITLAGGGKITNAAGASIIGYDAGIVTEKSTTIINAGTIAATQRQSIGIGVGAGSAVTNSAGGVITGVLGGVSGGSSFSLLNQGVIYTTSLDGQAVRAGGAITNAKTGTITGAEAVVGDGVLHLLNQGVISGTYASDAAVTGHGTITNAKTGTITGGNGILGDGTVHLLNQGLITGTYGSAVAVSASGTVTNAATGTIDGRTGIVLTGGTIINAGTIATNGSGNAIDLEGTADNTIILQNGGTIFGAIAGFIAGDVIDDAGVTITSETFANGELSLFDGTKAVGALDVTGNLYSGSFMLKSDGHGGTEIELGAFTLNGVSYYGIALSALSSTIAATATILNYGIQASAYRDWTLANFGTIHSYYDAVYFAASGKITNAGVIDGVTGVKSAGQLTNTGVIEGGTGINFDGGTLINAGTIAGSYGTAIDLSTTAATDIILDSGSTLEGGISGFATGDTIDLANITASGEIFGNGVLTLTNAGKVVDTITLNGQFKTSVFTLTAAQGGGTDIGIAPTETISGRYGAAITLVCPVTSITSQASIGAYSAIYAPPGRNWTVVNAGTLDGSHNAVQLTSGRFTNTGSGLVEGGFTGLHGGSLYGGIILSNAGTIAGTLFDGVGVELVGSESTLTNLASGVISGGAQGVVLRGFAATLVNDGTIIGPSALYVNGGAVRNEGLLKGTGYSGNPYYVYPDTGLKVSYSQGENYNGIKGTILGAIGVRTTAKSNFTNAGRVEGLPILATYASVGIRMDGGTVTNDAGGIISGAIGVRLDGGTLTDAGTIASTIASAGIAIAMDYGFGAGNPTLILDKGNVIKGAIANFTGGDVLDFAATSITSESFANGILSVFDGASLVEKLSLTGDLNQQDFTLIPKGTLGTALILGRQILTGSYAAGITLSVPTTIAKTATITGRGNAIYAYFGPDDPILEGTQLTLLNEGLLTATLAANGVGVEIKSESHITNAAGGTMIGALYGVYSGPTTLTNAGSILATGTAGMGADIGYGTVENTGVIAGATGLRLAGLASTLANAGLITGHKYAGIDVASNDVNITNRAGGTIAGGTGIAFNGASGTVSNAGTIDGTGGTAIAFASGGDRFIDDPGARLIGGMTAGAGRNILELASAAAAGTLAGIGETIFGFSTIAFDAGAAFSLQGDIAGLAVGQSIEGFAANDSIILDNFSASSFSTIAGGLVLHNAGGSVTLDITTTSGGNFSIHAAGNATTISTSAAAIADGAVITTGVLSSQPLGFLRPEGWRMNDQPAVKPLFQNAAILPEAVAAEAPRFAGWLNVEPTPSPAFPVITLHPG